jgi:CRP/FNR family transcriptional regulator, nitrogen oxide reductase regulator
MTQDRSHPFDLAERLLAGLDSRARGMVIAEARRQELHAAQVLFRMGEPADELFVLARGRVKFGRGASTGREVVLGILMPGDVFGLGSLVDGFNAYIGTAEALENGDVLVWSREVIQRLAAVHARLSWNALQIALGYVTQFAELHETFVSHKAEERLAAALIRLASRVETPSPSGIEIRVTNEQLASFANVSVFTVSRLLKRWERAGALNKSRGAVYIVSPERLLVA